MKRSRISHNIYNWASFLKGLAFIVIIIGFVVMVYDTTAGIIVAASCIPIYLTGVFGNGIGVITEAANKYLESTEKEPEEKAESVQ